MFDWGPFRSAAFEDLKADYLLFYFLITATKIEFFVGDVPDEQLQDLENARYTRLG